MKGTKNHVRFLALNYLGKSENGEITAPDPRAVRADGAACVEKAEKDLSKALGMALGFGFSEGRNAIESAANKLASACEERAYEEGMKAGAQLMLQLLDLNVVPKRSCKTSLI